MRGCFDEKGGREEQGGGDNEGEEERDKDGGSLIALYETVKTQARPWRYALTGT